MKLLPILFSLCLTEAALLARESTNVSPTSVALAAREFFAATRSNAVRGIELKLKSPRIRCEDLDAMLATMYEATTKLHQAAFDKKLDLAARQVETVRTQVVVLLKDPANKSMALGLEPQQWLDQITLQKSVGKILEADIARLRATVQELRQWAAVMESVAPESELTDRLKKRLKELVADWKKPRSARDADTTEAPLVNAETAVTQKQETSRREGETTRQIPANTQHPPPAAVLNANGSTIPPQTTINTAPLVADVLKLVKAGVAENVVLAFIDASSAPFNLTDQHVNELRASGLSWPLIPAMKRRDAAFGAMSQSQPSVLYYYAPRN